MLFLCCLTCRIILYNRPCTSQRGIALPLWKPLLNQLQYPARITWRFLIRAGAAAPLSNFALTRKVVLKRRIPSAHLRSTSQLAASGLPECIRQTALTSVRGADRACCCWLSTFLQQPLGVFYTGELLIFPDSGGSRIRLRSFQSHHRDRPPVWEPDG